MIKEQKAMSIIRDRDIREPLFDYLEETYGKIRIIEEKMMGRSRADVRGTLSKRLYDDRRNSERV